MINSSSLHSKLLYFLFRLANYCYEKLLFLYFLLQGQFPHKRGYHIFKKREVMRFFNKGENFFTTLPTGYGYLLDERVVEYPWFFSRLPSSDPGTLLDAGSVLNFDYILDHPSLQNKQITIATLAPEKKAFWRRGISYLFDDLRSTCLKDDYFDWIVSMSTLEHIGLDNTTYYTGDPSKMESNNDDYLKVVAEMRRILKPGGTLFLSIPFGNYANHGWLQVFDNRMVSRILETFSPTEKTVQYFSYRNRGWETASQEQCSDAIFYDYHRDGFSRTAPPASEAIICLTLVK